MESNAVFERIENLALSLGAYRASVIPVENIQTDAAFRDMCAANACGQYGKRWSCPPGCGSLDECAETLRSFRGGILVQTCGDIEDGFDFEAMMEIEQEHKEHFSEMHDTLLEKGIKVLALGAGCCTICPKCTYPDSPCRFPERAVASMEAFGMVVLEVCKANGLQYYYGADRMAYTSCFLIAGE